MRSDLNVERYFSDFHIYFVDISVIFIYILLMKITEKEQITRLLPKYRLRREIFRKFSEDISSQEVQILYGPRQVGKSTLTLQVISDLWEKGERDLFYFNLDIIPPDFSSPDKFLASIMAQKTKGKGKTYVFLDEAQRLSDIGLFIKYLYDQKMGIKFVLTGSASLDIKSKIKEPLTGRKKEFYLPPLSLAEILEDKGIKLAEIRGSFEILENVLEEYLLYGGYPEAYLLQDANAKKEKLTEIAQSYILRDMMSLFGISESQNVQLIASYLAENTGNILSKERLSMLSSIGKYEVEKILNALEKSFVIWLIRPFAKNKARELVHRPKVYFQDLGIRNALLGKFEPALVLADKGKLFENAMASELASNFGKEKIGYWRTIGGTEVDFIVAPRAGEIMAYEAKYAIKGKTKPRNLATFQKHYGSIVKKSLVLGRENYWKLYQ